MKAREADGSKKEKQARKRERGTPMREHLKDILRCSRLSVLRGGG